MFIKTIFKVKNTFIVLQFKLKINKYFSKIKNTKNILLEMTKQIVYNLRHFKMGLQLLLQNLFVKTRSIIWRVAIAIDNRALTDGSGV
jgi:hypothetical protein